jgi:peptidoglycan hydrolase CwlO-like protein
VLEDRVQKMMGSEAVIKELSRELDDLNKKGLDQTRVINHLKLEKDAGEEELRLLKKRQNDHIRVSTEWEEKAASLERALEEQRRKEGKFKREID